MNTPTVATGVIRGETQHGGQVELAYFGSTDLIEGDRLLAMKVRQVRKEGHTVISTSLQCPSETIARCIGWVAFIREDTPHPWTTKPAFDPRMN